MIYPIKCVLLEDELEWQGRMKKYISAFPELELAGAAQTNDEAFRLIVEHRPQAAFMDIRLYEGTVFDLLERLQRSQVPIPLIVMITAYPDYAIDALNQHRRHVVKFLTKPMLTSWREKMREAIDAVAAELREAQPPAVSPEPVASEPCFVKVQDGNILVRIPCADLVWLEVAGEGRTFVYTDEQRYLANATLVSIMEEFPHAPILRISRKLAVNRHRVKYLNLNDKAVVFHYQGGEKSLYVGKSYFNDVKDNI